ncbi:response regulator transcription factor [Pseudokineococcus lusitanus]|uniref:Two-component system response regulator VanR n=1 Tax=Pseudokineococcus lusitanus TaxID=763993 RepID=A0A3N1HT98_9ACTN|nr:response regulator transcription factor [Pseudokineococcus lusitanus]ROP45748.1 two-component system response regulator VanR [Pseudokineococcus lusitanus]
MRVLVVEDEPYLAEAVRDGLRLAAVPADVAPDGARALEMLRENRYDVVVLDRDLPVVPGDEVARVVAATPDGPRVLMLTAADRLDDKASGFALGADDYLVKPFAMRELVLRVRAVARRAGPGRPPVLEAEGVRLDPFRREVHREGHHVPLTRKQFAVLEVLMAADGGVVSAEDLLEQAWDAHADPFTGAVRVTMSTLRSRLGAPAVIHTVTGVGYRFGGPAAPAP